MTEGLAAWLTHPVTLTLASVGLASFFAVSELLLRSLEELGNVRFQGVLEEYPNLAGGRAGVQVSHIIDIGRWLQLTVAGGLWLVIFRVPGLGGSQALAIAIVLPLVMIVAAHFVFRPFSEDMITVLLRLIGPLVVPLVAPPGLPPVTNCASTTSDACGLRSLKSTIVPRSSIVLVRSNTPVE